MMETGMAIDLPPFGKFLDQLKAAGIQTATGRGFWGGVTPNGKIVVTSWTDQRIGEDRFKIWRPKTNHGGLKTAWEVGNVRVGTEVRVILIRRRGKLPGSSIGAAALTREKWRVVELLPDGKGGVVEPMRKRH
jgi:hypothetical protein